MRTGGESVANEDRTSDMRNPFSVQKRSHVDRLVTHHTTKLMSNPINIALMVVWAIACKGALVLSIVGDVFQSEAPVFPLIPTVTTSVGLNLLCACLCMLLGRRALRGFRLYQPFIGGQSFVVMQGFGHGILVISSIMIFIYVWQLSAPSAVYRYGTMTVLGCFNTAAVITLMVSLLFFVPRRRSSRSVERGVDTSNNDTAVWWHDLSASPNGEIGIVVSLSVAILACSSFAEFYPDLRAIFSVIGAVLLIISIVIIHLVIGYWYTPGYCLFMPNAGSLKMSVMQFFGWFLAAATLQFEMILCRTGASSPSSWHLLSGLSSVISISTLLLFVRLHRFPNFERSELLLLGEYGPLILTLAAAIHTAIVWGVALVLSSERYDSEPQLRQGFFLCQTLSSLLTFALPPCTHLLGRVAFGKVYGVWMPFRGPPEFVLLQSTGWTCFGLAIFFATLQLTENIHFRFVIIQSSLTALSQGFVHASLHLFDEGYKGRGSRYGNSSSDAIFNNGEFTQSTSWEEDEATLQEVDRSLVATVLNGEMLTSILLCMIGLLVRIVADVAVSSGSELDKIIHISIESLLKLSTVISFLVVPLAHISMRQRISIWRPFVGGGGFIAMQSVGWSIYVVNVLIAIANSFLGKRKSLMLPVMDEQYVFLEYTMEGLFATMPFVCIIIAAFFEAQEQSCKLSHQERSREKVLELFRVLQRAIPDEDDLSHAEMLLKAIAGPRWMDPPATDGARLIHEDEETAQMRQEAATHIVAILSVASALAFISATLLAERQPIFTLVFGAAGVVVTTISCFSVHYVYGTFLHRASGRYSFFMPFSGGPTFVALQTVGWSFYTVSLMMIILSCAEGEGTAIVFTTAGVFGIGAQYCILNSVPRFDPTPRPKSVFEQNAEGILAVLALIGSFAFAIVYDLYTQKRISGMTYSLLPIMVSAVSTCFAVPLGLVSLKRNANIYTSTSFSLFDNAVNSSESEDDLDRTISSTAASFYPTESSVAQQSITPSTSSSTLFHRRWVSELSSEFTTTESPSLHPIELGETSHATTQHPKDSVFNTLYISALTAAAFVAMVVSLVVPFAFGYVAYSYAYRSMSALHLLITSLRYLLFGFGVAVLVPLFAPQRKSTHRSEIWRRVHSALCCFTLYSIPTFVVVGSLGLPFVVNTKGAWAFATSMVVVSCISTIRLIHPITTLVNVCLFGYFVHYHLYTCLLMEAEPFALWRFVADIFFTGFWQWYFRRFIGSPHITGHLRSARMRCFFRRYVFPGVSEYFNFHVIVDGKPKKRVVRGHSHDNNSVSDRSFDQEDYSGCSGHNGGRDGKSDYVDMSNPKNKYLFSFHPHGVFPGSAIWVPITEEWEEAVGCNTEKMVTTHCADVVFAVPLLRDLALSLAALSVSRQGIECTLNQGNSPLVVTGGQAEMVLTRYSTTEMHLVTHHSGFVRLALRHRVPLVPIICFAEFNVMSNVNLQRIQRYTMKKVGFPFPTLPHGRWYLPLPNAIPLTVVVGKPILPEDDKDAEDNPEHVKRYRQRYFRHLEKLFFKYRAKVGYPNMELVLHYHDEVERLSQPEDATGNDKVNCENAECIT